MRSFNVLDRIGPWARAYLADQCGTTSPPEEEVYRLPLRAFGRLSVDELSKVRVSSLFMMSRCVEDAFEQQPHLAIIQKITSSMWRWGVNRAKWNNVVDAYNGIRRFDTGIPGLTATLDHTTSFNARGWSEYSLTYLDGVFAFLLHYKGQHVMTVGFSVAGDRRILLQQVQLTSRRGNRWLFKLPAGRLEFTIDRLRLAFPKHKILVADGAEIARMNLTSYQSSIEPETKGVERILERIEAGRPNADDPTWLKSAVASRATMIDKYAHLATDIDRIAAFYQDAGRYTRGGPATRMNSIDHFTVAA